ncbi:MAG: hypothetical protein M0C28_06100 [Candidatus Moduliflexus flocculans]|nr:hypothetical protein [Candidatus Moduliflexus flocculans]
MEGIVVISRDALHLAIALLWREAEPGPELRLLGYDRRLVLCAGTSGEFLPCSPESGGESRAGPDRAGGKSKASGKAPRISIHRYE